MGCKLVCMIRVGAKSSRAQIVRLYTLERQDRGCREDLDGEA